MNNLWMKAACVASMLALMGCGGSQGTATSSSGGGSLDVPTLAVQNPPATPPAALTPRVDDVQLRTALAAGGVQSVPAPPTANQARFDLGQALVFDKILSGNRDVACASCHQTGLSLADGLSVSLGTGALGSGRARTLGVGRHMIPRNAPALFNLAGVTPLMWDGRISLNLTPAGGALPPGLDNALAAQALFPLLDRDEMRGQLADGAANELAQFADNDPAGIWGAIMQRLLAIPGYVQRFQAAFPGVASFGIQHAANAIATFEVSQWSRLNSPFDNYVRGDNTALSEPQKRGALIFYGVGRCAVCHRGGLLSDLQFHNIASPQVGPGTPADAPLDRGQGAFRFRTPTLRNVALTGPWMHSGAYTSLTAVVRHYINPGQALRNYDPNQLDAQFRGQVHVTEELAAGVLNNLDPQLPINLSNDQVTDLVAFLESLTDPNPVPDAPANVPSGLPVSF